MKKKKKPSGYFNQLCSHLCLQKMGSDQKIFYLTQMTQLHIQFCGACAKIGF